MTFFSFILLFVLLSIFSTCCFISKNYATYSIQEILFFLITDNFDANSGYYFHYILNCLILPLLVSLLFVLLPYMGKILFVIYNKKERYIYCLFIFILVLSIDTSYILYQKAVDEKLINAETGDFYEKHFAEPNENLIKFPEKKNNLLIIVAESMEETFKNKKFYGGGESLIYDLEKLENNEIVFSNYIDGYGTTPTEPSLIAMFTGLPINLISVNTINNKIIKNIFKNVYSLGKILADNGYNNVSLRGSNGNFSGTHQFLSEHGVKKNIGQFELMNRQYNPKYEPQVGIFRRRCF